MIGLRQGLWRPPRGGNRDTPRIPTDTPNFTPGAQRESIRLHTPEGVGAQDRKRKGQQYATLKIIIYIFLVSIMDVQIISTLIIVLLSKIVYLL